MVGEHLEVEGKSERENTLVQFSSLGGSPRAHLLLEQLQNPGSGRSRGPSLVLLDHRVSTALGD